MAEHASIALEPHTRGDPNSSAGPASLAALKTAIGSGSCPKYHCDYNGDGKMLAAGALLQDARSNRAG